MGGETTVTLRGDGHGGRNLELALAAALAIDGWPNRAIVAFATDGDDGPTDAAGALVSGQTASQAGEMGLDAREHLDNNNSYPLLAATGSLIITGQTGTNVNDLIFLLTYS
jgi:hydroxypyruvate reductase